MMRIFQSTNIFIRIKNASNDNITKKQGHFNHFELNNSIICT